MKNIFKNSAIIGVISAFAACGEAPSSLDEVEVLTTPDGVLKSYSSGKADGWNQRNSPNLFEVAFDYNFYNLPARGATDKVAWAANYWPVYRDGINHRWQGNHILSPVEKYDKAYNGWRPNSNFMNLRPFDLDTCEFDSEYYRQLGRAATHVNRNNGNYNAHNGVDDDEDGVSDAQECNKHETRNGEEVVDYDGIETWFGICHAWAPAAVLEDEPLKAVVHNGVRFETSDIKALLIQQYDQTSSLLVGDRCEEEKIKRDANGRVTNDECRDLNAGSWHVAITNLLGNDRRPFIIERTANYEVWNQPLVGYQIVTQNEISLERANGLLNLASGTQYYTYNPAAVKFVEVQMRTDWITESDPQIGPTTPTNDRYVRHDNYHYILELDRDNKIIGGEWVGESNLTHPDFIWTPTGQPHGNPHISLAEVRKLIEISRQDSQAVTPTPPGTGNNSCGAKTQPACNHGGGEWDLHCNPGCNPGSDKRCWGSCAMGSSTTPIRPTNVPTNNALTLRNNIRVAIPDGNPAGIRSVINSDDGGLIKSVKLSLNIQHQYRGDLVVQLRHGSAVVTIFDGQNDANPWSNDLIISNQAVEGFLSTPVAGQWELIVTDYGDLDTGSIIDWKLNVQTR